MVMFHILTAFAAAASPAVSQPAAAAAAPTRQAQEPSDLERVICRRHDVLGSRAQRERICLTKREWTKLDQGTRDAMYDFQRRATQGVLGK